MRRAFALLGGFAVSAVGFVVVIGSDLDLVGVLLITIGVAVALLLPTRRSPGESRSPR